MSWRPITPTILRMTRRPGGARAAATGEADQLLARVEQLRARAPALLNELGLRMMQRGEALKARSCSSGDRGRPEHTPALVVQPGLEPARAAPAAGRDGAIERALALEPRHLTALLQKGNLIEDRGDARNAARIYRNALAIVPPDVTPPESLSAALERARAAVAPG